MSNIEPMDKRTTDVNNVRTYPAKVKLNSRQLNSREQFIETARRIDADESEEAFERTFGRIVPPRRPSKRPDPSHKRAR
jgi:hypothetical protein